MSIQLASPANPYRSGPLYGRMSEFLGALKELRMRSALRRSLGNVNDRLLQDVGLVRHDLGAACADGLSHAAAAELEAAARRRAGNW